MKIAPYQIEAAGFMFERDSSMLFARMGTGKTLTNLTAMVDWLEEGHAKRIMVVAPLRVVNNVWRQENRKWGTGLRMGRWTGDVKSVLPEHNVILTNYENMPAIMHTDHGCDAVVFDELSRLRNPTGKWQKAARKGPFRIRTGSTGTPAPNGLMSLYGMCHAVGLGHLVGRNFEKWQRQYFYTTDYMGYNWSPLPGTPVALASLIKPYTYVLEDSAVELPPIIRPPIAVELPPDLRATYERLRKTSVLSDLDILASSNGVLRNKLRQIASGFIYDNKGDTCKLSQWRMNVIEDIVAEQQGQPTIIAYEYREQLAMLQRRWPGTPYMGGGSKDDEKTIRDWNEQKLPLMFIHAASAGHGLNLQDGGNAIIWWTLPDDLELYDQTIARLVRRGQKNASVYSYEPIALDTVEVLVRQMAHQKDTVQKGLWENLR